MPFTPRRTGLASGGLAGRAVNRSNTRRVAQQTPSQREAERAYLTTAGQYRRATGVNPSTRDAYHGWMNEWAAGGTPSLAPAAPAYNGGGGGRGYGRGGGGGGGGGAPALTQAMFDQMVGLLGAGGPQLQMSQVDLPDFTGTNIAAFDPKMFNDLRTQLSTAVAADQAAVNQGAQQTTQALQQNYTNPYANATVQGAPAAEQMGVALQQTAGGGGDQAAVAAQSNQAAGQDQASFANLLQILGANSQASQGSRLNQVALDAETARRGIGAQNLGLGSQIGMAQGRAQQQWAQQDAERRYQNSLMAQQWQREEMMRNQDLTNQGAQANWQQRNEMINNRMTPLLELLGQTAGGTVKTDALTQLLARWGQR